MHIGFLYTQSLTVEVMSDEEGVEREREREREGERGREREGERERPYE